MVTALSEKVDYELELAAVVGKPLARGERLLAAEADEHIFRFVLSNDWNGESLPHEARLSNNLRYTPLI